MSRRKAGIVMAALCGVVLVSCAHGPRRVDAQIIRLPESRLPEALAGHVEPETMAEISRCEPHQTGRPAR